MATKPKCHRCGDQLDYVDVTSMTDTEPRYLAVSECDCPGPRCSLCDTRIDQHTRHTSPGECPNPECVLWCHLVPIVNVA